MDKAAIESIARAIAKAATPATSEFFGNSMVALAWVVSAFINTIPQHLRPLLWGIFQASVEEKIFTQAKSPKGDQT